MTRRDPLISMQQMRDHARYAVEFANGRSRQELEADRYFEFALTHAVELVGEAARRVPESVRRRHKSIDWENVIDFRHRLAHGYDTVDLGRLWLAATSQLPQLIAQLDEILGPEEKP